MLEPPWLMCRRFIPACVGNTIRRPDHAAPVAVHPRVCGEYDLVDLLLMAIAGSSPRVWGIRRTGDFQKCCHRFIPACVGNTSSSRGMRSPATVHPRVCGEYSLRLLSPLSLPGSSPRVWGILSNALIEELSVRFIPACVGNTTLLRPSAERCRFIPACVGNTPSSRPQHNLCGGSSPRVWGIRNPSGSHLVALRFIPACVGNTGTHAFDIAPVAVHPRVCGEYGRAFRTIILHYGSSPRVWGIP